MRILYLYKDYYPVLGGIENYTRQLAEGMLGRGHRVEVLVTNSGPTTRSEEFNGVPVLKAGRWLKPASTPLSPRLTMEYLRRVWGERPRPDIVHLQFPYPPAEVSWLLGDLWPGRRRPRAVITYHSDIIRQKRLLQVYRPLLRQVLKRADIILPTSPAYLRNSPFLQPYAAKCRVVPPGVEVERFAAAHPRRLPFEDAQVILFAGRLRYYKGLRYLLEALPLVVGRARLVIVGRGPEEAALKAQAARSGLTERIYFAGDVDDAELPGYYRAADLLALPSSERSEAFGLVLLEAMAAGRAVISTELGTGTSYVNRHGLTGLVVPPADPVALARAINELLADDSRREEMGRRGQEVARAEFSLDLMLDRIEQVYRERLARD